MEWKQELGKRRRTPVSPACRVHPSPSPVRIAHDFHAQQKRSTNETTKWFWLVDAPPDTHAHGSVHHITPSALLNQPASSTDCGRVQQAYSTDTLTCTNVFEGRYANRRRKSHVPAYTAVLYTVWIWQRCWWCACTRAPCVVCDGWWCAVHFSWMVFEELWQIGFECGHDFVRPLVSGRGAWMNSKMGKGIFFLYFFSLLVCSIGEKKTLVGRHVHFACFKATFSLLSFFAHFFCHISKMAKTEINTFKSNLMN